ncbi:MAG: hypothetical protein GY922_08305 [Proteobacteria bacterium]|nr:hypothetical protein [Pseudomonadota bacterium]
MALNNGYRWVDGATETIDCSGGHLYLCLERKSLTYDNNPNSAPDNDALELSTKEYVKLLNGTFTPNFPPEMRIGEFDVKIYPGKEIQFGCTKLSDRTVKALIKAYQSEE